MFDIAYNWSFSYKNELELVTVDISFNLMTSGSFWKFCQNCMLGPPGGLTPRLRENAGTATELGGCIMDP